MPEHNQTIIKQKANKCIVIVCSNIEEEKNKGKISWPEEVIQ